MAAPTEKTKEGVDKKSEGDAELDALLDSALADFGDEESQKKTEASGGGDSATKSSHGDPISDMFAEEFSDEMSKHFEEAMKSVMEDDPELLTQINKLAEAAGNAGDSPSLQKEFGETLKETLSSLAHNTEGLQDHEPSDDEMMKMFAGMGLNGQAVGGEDGGFMPMMQGMMKTLLSKDVLYPSLKEINDKYPKWLKDNENNKKFAADMNNYRLQHRLIGDIISEFDAEKESDSDEVKSQRFEKIMDLMQQMQDLGQPPKEIVGEMAPGLQFDKDGLPVLPGSSEACSVM